MHPRRWGSIVLLTAWVGLASESAASFINLHAVYEFKNSLTGRHFLTGDDAEIAAIEATGTGWAKTGFAFTASGGPGLRLPFGLVDHGVRVSRFVRETENGAVHFFTLAPTEVEVLRQPGSGWTLEGSPFTAERAGRDGQCPSILVSASNLPLTLATVPVFRLNSGARGLGHRFVGSTRERDAMLAAGWVDEGVAFCAYGILEIAFKSFAFEPENVPREIPWSCTDQGMGSCLVFTNLPPPRFSLFYYDSAQQATFGRVSGTQSDIVYTSATPAIPASAEEAASQMFLQLAPGTVGMHFDGRFRGPSEYTSIVLRRKLSSSGPAQGADDRFFPWSGTYASDTQLALSFWLRLRTLAGGGAQGHAYGHPTIEFADQVSRQRFLFSVLAFGTTAPAGDDSRAALDAINGKVIVGSEFGASTTYGRSVAGETMRQPTSDSRQFEFRMDRGEFQRAVDAARRLNPALSPDPANYFVDNFQYKSELYRDGRVGMSISGLTLRLLAR